MKRIVSLEHAHLITTVRFLVHVPLLSLGHLVSRYVLPFCSSRCYKLMAECSCQGAIAEMALVTEGANLKLDI